MSATAREIDPSPHEITEIVAGPLERTAPRGWWLGFLTGLAATALLVVGVGRTWSEGLGVSGLNEPVATAFTLASFVFWVGLACSGMLVAAALFFFGGSTPTALRRIAETMSLAALATSAIFLWIQLGRPWVVYWLAPLPNQMEVWPQARSPLAWTFFAFVAFAVVSKLLVYAGSLPELAILRDRAAGRRRELLAALALGWRGSQRQGRQLHATRRILAGGAGALALCLLAIVARDLAGAHSPGWHATLFAPSFVAGAILSGAAMVVTLAVIARQGVGLGELIEPGALDLAARVLAAAALVVAAAHLVERFGGEPLAGAGVVAFAATVVLTLLAPQLLWLERVRASRAWLLALSLLALAGGWCERFLLVTGSLQRDLLPATWSAFRPTGWDFALLAGGAGLFVALFCLLARVLPLVAVATTRAESARGAADATDAEPVAS